MHVGECTKELLHDWLGIAFLITALAVDFGLQLTPCAQRQHKDDKL